MDDILICHTGTIRQITNFLNYLNSLHNKIEFTLEHEQNKSINFLDLHIENVNNKHEFSIYHKPTHTDTTLHNTSTHPLVHKHAAYHSMVHRLLKIPMTPENYNKELNIIKQIAVANGFDIKLINNLIKKKNKKLAIAQTFPIEKEQEQKFASITYLSTTTRKVTSACKKLNLKIAYKTNNTIGRWIKNYKDKIDVKNKAGVYKLICGSCNKCYIGKTNRTFDIRIKEHLRAFNNKKTTSTYAEHLLQEKHVPNPKFKILHVSQKKNVVDLLEIVEINKLKYEDTIVNNQLVLNNSPLLNLFVKRTPPPPRPPF